MGRNTTVVSKDTWLPQPPEQVFNAVMSPEIAPLIDPGVRVWQPDLRPIGVGTRFTIRGRFQWLPVRGLSEVTLWEPPTRGEFRSVKPTWPMHLEAAHVFEPDRGGTHYTWTVTFHHGNALGRAISGFAARLLERTIEDQHRTLTAWLAEHGQEAELARL